MNVIFLLVLQPILSVVFECIWRMTNVFLSACLFFLKPRYFVIPCDLDHDAMSLGNIKKTFSFAAGKYNNKGYAQKLLAYPWARF